MTIPILMANMRYVLIKLGVREVSGRTAEIIGDSRAHWRALENVPGTSAKRRADAARISLSNKNNIQNELLICPQCGLRTALWI